MMHRVLVVEDDEVCREVVGEALELAGYQVERARNGKEAIRLVRQAPPALIVSDIIMPEKDGFEMMNEIRRDHPTMPWIAMSGGGRASADLYLKTAHGLGAVMTLSKPFDLKDLVGAVNRVFGS